MSNESTVSKNVQSVPGNGVSGNSMHAVLIEHNVGMCELWLPATVEGKYTFPNTKEQLSIAADGSVWKARVTNGGFFSVNDNKPDSQRLSVASEIVLMPNTLSSVCIGNRTFSLYLEDNCDSIRKFLTYNVEKNIDILIGREYVCDIQYLNKFVSREHAVLRYAGDRFVIIDKGSKNGVYVNGRRVQSAELSLGDVVYIMGLCIIIGAGYIAMNNADKCKLTTQRIYLMDNRNKKMEYLQAKGDVNSFYDRKPRKKYKLDKKPIEIELPPSPIPKTKIPLALRMGSSMLMGGQALFAGNYIGMLTSAVLPTLTQGITEKDRKQYEVLRIARYREYLRYKEQEIATEIEYEENFYNTVFPNFYDTLNFLKTQNRLWERRRIDDDFLTVRLGTGTIPMVAEKRYQERKFEMEPDPLLEEMYEMAERPSLLNNVPITLSLKEDWVVGVLGEQQRRFNMIIRMISYIAINHAYDDVKMVILASESIKKEFEFVKFLPHFWDDERSIRFFATNNSDSQAITKYFRDKNILSSDKNKKIVDPNVNKHTAYIVFALDKNLSEHTEFVKEILESDKYAGFSLVAAFDNVPKECTKIVDLRYSDMLVSLSDPDAADVAFKAEAIDMNYLRDSMNRLSKIKLLMENDQSYLLPSMITFLDLYNVGRVEHLSPLARWERNNPVSSLAVPIGVGTDGNIFNLDLHEKYQGPHGLVAGMTGSGKSEFIITYILSMAVNFSPDEVAFVLIDYKGGGLADAFVDPKRNIHLPHVVATITNLDGAAIQRSLTSIHSELSRRQEMFKRAKSETGEGTMDIYDYQRMYRNKQVSEPMPHLFIISDEFAELKKQEPEFMDALISAARIGRSLGVHLILATQKPGGVVNDQIWSNSKFRACLKVQDRSDSMEMLKRPEAAEIKQTGRFYLQVGYNEFFALGQSAWCGAGYVPQDKIVKETDSSVDFLDNTGQVILKSREKKAKTKAENKQIVAIVKYLSDLAKRENIIPRSLWCEPLPSQLEYKSLAEGLTENNNDVTALIGMVDDPEHQKQYPLLLNTSLFHHMGLIGTSGSGKSTFFKTMLYSLVMNYTPDDVNFYILDLSGGSLSVFKDTPHCGAYLTKENESDFDRLLDLVQDIVNTRKQLFTDADVFSYDDYIKINKLPAVFVVLDSWTNINDFAKGQQYGLFISKNMRDAANYGIHFVFSVNHMNEFSAKVRQELDYTIVLQAKDKFEYNDILNVRTATKPPELPGRGVCATDGKALEYQVATPYCLFEAQEQALRIKADLKERSEQIKQYMPAKRLPVLDAVLEYEDFCSSFNSGRIPLGFAIKTMKETAIPLKQLYTMSLYFGNPLGVKPVISNLLSAFHREAGDVVIVRRQSGTIFDRDTEIELKSLFGSHYTIMDISSNNSVDSLFELLIQDYIPKTRIPLRDEYCRLHGIPESDKGRTVKAANYIRSKTTPMLVLFESFVDLINADTQQIFGELFAKLRGFNIYFAGCFYPEDEKDNTGVIFRNFVKDDFALLFGGQFHKVWVTGLTNEYRSMEKVNPNYNRFVMKYHNDYHRMVMPCGEITFADQDPDDEEIV